MSILSSNVLQPVLWGGDERAEYTIGVAGCERRTTYVVVRARLAELLRGRGALALWSVQMEHYDRHPYRYRYAASVGVALAIGWASAAGQQLPPTPDPVLGPNAVPADPALGPNAVPTAPALTPQQTNPGPVLRPGAVPTDPALGPNAVPTSPALSPEQTRPAPVLAPVPSDSLAPLPPIYPPGQQ